MLLIETENVILIIFVHPAVDVNLALKPVLVKNKADWMMAQQESFKRAVM